MPSAEYNFTFILSDTDSVTFSKPDGSSFTKEEEQRLVNEINEMLDPEIRFESNGTYQRILITKAKNYVLFNPDDTTIKGSALKATSKEPRLKQFIDDIINTFLRIDDEVLREEKQIELYNGVALEIMNIKDIGPWCSKKTVTDKILNPVRSNEQNVLDAIGNKHVQEGDKVYVFYEDDKTLALGENFNGNYSTGRLLDKLFKTIKIFDSVLNIEKFPNYKLKKNNKLLMEMT